MNWYKIASSSRRQQLVKIANDARDVVFEGVLRQTQDGFVYVDIPNSIFDGFLPLLGGDLSTAGADGIQKPPTHEKHFDVGAHISVIKSKEIASMGLLFKDTGKKIRYVINGVKRVDGPDGWNEIETVWFLTVASPDLERLRQKYNLSPRIKDHDFHITLGVKPRPMIDDTFA